jgi:hypothetical protein
MNQFFIGLSSGSATDVAAGEVGRGRTDLAGGVGSSCERGGRPLERPDMSDDDVAARARSIRTIE